MISVYLFYMHLCSRQIDEYTVRYTGTSHLPNHHLLLKCYDLEITVMPQLNVRINVNEG